MSLETTVYDGILSKLSTILPSHKVIPFPYDLESNSETVLRLGYGLVVGPGINPKRTVSCLRDQERTYVISITRQTFASSFTAKDDAARNLLEDKVLIQTEAENASNFGLGNTIATFRYEGDNGIEQLREGSKFLKIDVALSASWFENI